MGYIIQNCIALDPKKRYQSVHKLERQLGMYWVTELKETIPGFRTGVWWKKAVASIVYLVSIILVIGIFGAELESTGTIMNSIAVTVFLILFLVPPYMLITNFLRLRNKLPLFRSKFIRVKIWGFVLYLLAWLLLIIIGLMIFAVLGDTSNH